MKNKKLTWFVIATIALGIYAYVSEIHSEKVRLEKEEQEKKLMQLQIDQINYLEIEADHQKTVFQKGDEGWSILEPVQDAADRIRIQTFLEQIATDTQVSLIKESNDLNWKEFGLDQPESTIVIKNNLGRSQRIELSAIKNFEGLTYARVDGLMRLYVVPSAWVASTKEKLVLFREKRLFREAPVKIKKIAIKSLSDQFSLEYKDEKWIAVDHESEALDQDKVQQMIRELSESTIQDYLNEGEPSEKEKKELGLIKAPVQVQIETELNKWGVMINLDDKNKVLYALTNRPTYLVQLDLTRWEFFGNLTLDSLRDRKSIMTFNLTNVSKVFAKINGQEYQFEKYEGQWKMMNATKEQDNHFTPAALKSTLIKLHDLELSHFLNHAEGALFNGKNMIILKSSSDQLVFQINWGPTLKKKFMGVEKEFYLARTQSSETIFGLDKDLIDGLIFDPMQMNKDVTND